MLAFPGQFEKSWERQGAIGGRNLGERGQVKGGTGCRCKSSRKQAWTGSYAGSKHLFMGNSEPG